MADCFALVLRRGIQHSSSSLQQLSKVYQRQKGRRRISRMWNPLDLVLRLIRTLVSSDKVRLVSSDGRFNLDFTYITSRIIGMAFPARGLEAIYRNPIDEVAGYLRTKHGNKFRIYNLSERKYDYGKFDDHVVEIGFPDHHNPPLHYLKEICKNMDEWLNMDPENVAVVHCLAGRGRTGTVIAAYLVYCGMFDNGGEALDFFALRRSSTERGVNHPSQRRYVQYFSEILSGREPDRAPLLLKKAVMYSVPSFDSVGGCRPLLEIFTAPTQFTPKRLIYSSAHHSDSSSGSSSPSAALLPSSSTSGKSLANSTPYYRPRDGSMSFSVNTVLCGDIYIRCYHIKPNGKRKYMFRVSVNTGFVTSGVLRLTKSELDDAAKKHQFDKDFFMDLNFTVAPAQSIEERTKAALTGSIGALSHNAFNMKLDSN